MNGMKPLNLYQKISAVMKEVSYLQKDANIKFANTNYKAVSEEKVTIAVREALIKFGLIIIPFEQEHSREGTLSTVDTKYKIIDIDTGQQEIIVSSGTGADTQDKGVGKAMTYSYKYLCLRTFAIPTGEDPDKVSSAELDSKNKNGDKPQSPPPNNNNQQSNNNTGDNITPGQIKAVNTNISILSKLAKTNSGKLITRLEKEVGQFGSVTGMSKSQATKSITLLKEWTETTKSAQGGAQ